ncbi:MAG: F0F1 ATP synthase subunit delta [Gammaproteobacteria bacterium]
MLENLTIARPYAKAVFEQAQAGGDLALWSTSLALLGRIVADPLMHKLIKNPKVSHEQLTGIVLVICGGHVDEKGKNFVRILVESGRLSVAKQISILYEELKAEAEGTAGVEVISAYPLEDRQQEQIRKVMAKRLGKKIEITTSVDQSLIGGAVIRAGDSVIDASLRGRLQQLSRIIAE